MKAAKTQTPKKNDVIIAPAFQNPTGFTYTGKLTQSERLKIQQAMIEEKFEDRVFVYDDNSGNSACFGINGNHECYHIADTKLDSMILKIFEDTPYNMTASRAKELRLTWIGKTNLRKTILPPLVVFKDDIRLAFKRIAFSPDSSMDCPIFKKIYINRVTNNRAMSAFLWSIFVESSSSQQYLYLKGEGEDGKGTLMRILMECLLGEGAVALNADSAHLAASLVGKRLGVFNDIKNTHFMMSSIFMQITGGDKVQVRNLYERPYTMSLNVKFILTANSGPSLSSQKADSRRCILSIFNPLSEFEKVPNLEEELIKELPGILAYCKEAFEELYDAGTGKIKSDTTGVEEAGENFELPLEIIWNKFVIQEEKDFVRKIDLASAVNISLKAEGLKFDKFVDYIARVYKIKAHRPVINGVKSSGWIFSGIRLKNFGDDWL